MLALLLCIWEFPGLSTYMLSILTHVFSWFPSVIPGKTMEEYDRFLTHD